MVATEISPFAVLWFFLQLPESIRSDDVQDERKLETAKSSYTLRGDRRTSMPLGSVQAII